MTRKKRSGSLRSKLLISFISMIAVIFALSGVIIVTNVSANVTSMNDSLTSQVVKAHANEMGTYMDGMIHEMAMWADNDVITSGDKTAIMPSLMAKQPGLRSDFEMAFFSDALGAAVTSLGSEINIADRQYYDDIVNGGKDYTVSNPLVSKATNEIVFVVASAVKGSNGDTIGVLGATIKLDKINEISNSIDLGGTGRPWVIDGTGLLVAHPNDKVRMVLTVQNSAENGFIGMDKVGERMLAQETGFGKYTDTAGKTMYVYYAPIPSTPGWSVAYSATETDVMAPIVSLETTIVIIVLLALLVGAAATLILSGSIVKPIKATARLAKALASGELDKVEKVRVNDEVGQLANILDKEVRNAFKDIEAARLVADKRAGYQKCEVDKLLVNLQRLERGELYCDIVVEDADDDTSELFELFRKIASSLCGGLNAIKSYIAEISQVLGEMSRGNLYVGIESEYKGDFVELKQSINIIIDSLNSVMSEINIASEQVASGTRQVSDGSQEISQGASEQTASLEELTTTMSMIAEQTRKNAQSAGMAKELSAEARTGAEKGNEQMQTMQRAMSAINESSQGIGKIIKVIDDIAFQTNILALNAAVEAARAGAHGKGFAVVAEEVRNLAARSAAAAKETTEMIEDSIRKTAAGTKIADETALSLSEIVDGIEKSGQLVGEIAAASDEQALSIDQMNQSIEQLSAVVSTNSATSEEAAAAAEELSGQAELLKNMVARFTLKNDETRSQIADLTTVKHSARKKVDSNIPFTEGDFGKY